MIEAVEPRRAKGRIQKDLCQRLHVLAEKEMRIVRESATIEQNASGKVKQNKND
jgi:hypothetical protein